MIITGKIIKNMRHAAGLSQTEVSRLAGISQAHIAKIENDKVDPRLSTVNNILHVIEGTRRRRKCVNYMKTPLMFDMKTSVRRIIKLMKERGISQIPVISGNVMVGSISESVILEKYQKGVHLKAKDIMDKPFPILDSDENVETAKALLDFSNAVMVTKKGELKGIITRSDVIGTG